MTITTFSELELDEGLLEALQGKGLTRPTAIQATVISPVLGGRNALSSTPIGTGKTAAYPLPVLQHLFGSSRKKSDSPYILTLTPAHELVIRVADHVCELAKHTHLGIATITGGATYMNHAEALSGNQDIVVITTGRLLQYMKKENFDYHTAETLILDGADRMLDTGFVQSTEHITGETHWRKQTLFFSATLGDDTIQGLVGRLLEDPAEVSTNPPVRERKGIRQWRYHVDDLKHKTTLLVHLSRQPEAICSVVFVRERKCVHELANWPCETDINNCYLEDEMVQGKCDGATKRLTGGRVNVLAAADVAARSIDASDVSHVFNFDMPRGSDTYSHRIERTAHAGRKGTAASLMEAHDHLLLGKVSHCIEESIKVHVIDELRSKTHAPSEKWIGKPSKKVLVRRAEKKEVEEKEKPRMGKRHRDTKNISKRRKPNKAGVPLQTTGE